MRSGSPEKVTLFNFPRWSGGESIGSPGQQQGQASRKDRQLPERCQLGSTLAPLTPPWEDGHRLKGPASHPLPQTCLQIFIQGSP